MKKTILWIPALVISLCLTGCAKNNVNKDEVGYRDQNAVNNRNANDHTRLHYNNPNYNNADINNNNRGPAMSTADNSRRDLRDDRNHNIIRNNNDNRSKMRVADQAADKVSDLPEVDTANVIVTENNAYVAAKLDNSTRSGLTNDIENKISKAVKSVDHDIDRVYVSVNPDFYDRMNTYASDIRNGRPVSGFFNQFNEMIRRVFPDLK